MRSAVKTFMLASTIALALPSLANARGFKHDNISPLSTPVNIEVVLSEEMQHRANNLPTRLRDRNSGSSRSVNAGFGNNGYYGEKSLNRLAESLEKKMTKRFEKKGISVSEDAPVTMRVIIEEAKNNRPTFRQLSQQPGLSFQSFGLGGASLSADLIDKDGASLGTMSYSYYETDFRQAINRFGPIWTDANRGFSRFANHAAKKLSN